jgi:16S rRNA (guanine527-N7)-methyltransferase
VTLTPDLEARLRTLTTAFLAENAKLNLSALRTPEACWVGNVLDSLPALDLPELTDARTLLDLGTGGGFPLLPLACARPDLSCTGLDATGKKIDAIGRIAQATGLSNVHLLTGRAEDLGHDRTCRERFDCVTARAVAPLPTLLEYAAPFVRTGGILVLWKSLHIDAELQASLGGRSTLSTHLLRSHRYTLPGDWGERQLLIFGKTATLKALYPRGNGLPRSKPL